MMKKISIYLAAALLLLSAASCDRGLDDLSGKKPNGGGNGNGNTTVALTPAPCSNKIVAHRGGSSECGMPDNSRASLKYAMSLKLYASECDIYWTKDNDVIIAHADGNSCINGLKPYEHTVTEIRKAGKLKNGEEIPTLEDFLDLVMVEGNCTKLCLDIKNITPVENASKAVKRACEIIKEKQGEKFCEFICTGNATVGAVAANCMVVYGMPVGWMANDTPANHKAKGYSWANLSTNYLNPYGSGVRSIDEFLSAGMEISVFNVDKQAGDGNAVSSDEAVAYYLSRYGDLRCICTNYPSWLLGKLKSLQ